MLSRHWLEKYERTKEFRRLITLPCVESLKPGDEIMTPLLASRSRNRAKYLLAFAVTIAAGLASRRFPQYLPAFLGKYPGDALWSLMVFLGLAIIFPRASTARVGLAALGFSFGIETLKLCDAAWLVSIRDTTLGHLVFGSTFSWRNLAAYTIGVALGFIAELRFTATPSA